MIQFFREIKEGMESFGKSISMVVNSILFTIVYFLGIGLTSIFSKVFGKNFMDLKIDKEVKTYWEDLNLTKKERRDYLNQF